MKKTFLLFTVLLAFGQFTMSQGTFGLKGGINLSNQDKSVSFPQSSSAHIQETKPMLGYQLGFFYKSSFNSKWGMALETNFSLIGSRNRYVTEESRH